MKLSMLSLFRALLKQERPSLIVDTQVKEYKQLSSVTCKYEKDGHYYVAISFFTVTWIGKNPWGPTTSGEVVPCYKLSDIAIIHECSTLTACRNYPAVSEEDLKDYIGLVETKTLHLFDSLFVNNPWGDTLQASISFAPVPTVMFAITQGDDMVGTIAVLFSGAVVPVFVCNARIYDYAEHMRELFVNVTNIALPSCTEKAGEVSQLSLGG